MDETMSPTSATTSATMTSSDPSGPDTNDTSDTNDTDDTDTATTGPSGCGADEACVPAVPTDWSGPIVVASGSCPAEFPEDTGVLNRSLVPGVPQCSCSCTVDEISCQLILENNGVAFSPDSSCESPPFEDECVGVTSGIECADMAVDIPATPSWEVERLGCGGAVEGRACDAGTCIADTGDAICIQRDGEHDCPAPFDDRTLFHRAFDDSRSCSGCSCQSSSPACEADVEICSLGFDQVTLESDGGCYQLNSSDGDGVTLFSTAVVDQGSCDPAPETGEVSGDVVETEPVTVCCL